MATKAFLRALRKKHHLGEFRRAGPSKTKSRVTKRRRVSKGGFMARRKRSYSRSRGGGKLLGGLNNWAKIALYSGGAAAFAPQATNGSVSPNIAGAVGGWYASKSLIGGAVGYLIGPKLAQMAGPIVGNVGMTSSRQMLY